MAKPIDTERRLVAILAADVEGYSRLMAADEVATLQALTQRRTILDGLISARRGRIANTAGDSVLAEFGSAVDAVRCAVEAQAALTQANVGLSLDRHINFRIGVHVGDVMVKDGDLFGDGVNIAARLQALASAGGTCISGAAHDQVRKILAFAFTDLGARQVKNIGEPIRAFAVAAENASAAEDPAHRSLASADNSKPLPLPDKPSIAVLPFQNMSGDAEQEYFADGMVEDIITALSRFKSLFVIARNSTFTYKGKPVDIKQVGRELGVRYVLEGSIRKASNRVRITGQLIEASSGAHLWADHFDGALDDIFALQDQVVESIVGVLMQNLERAEVERMRRKPTASTDAYDWFLRAVTSARTWSRASIDESLSFCMRAIALDPNFAPAYGQAALCYSLRKTNGWLGDLQKDMAEAERMARSAWAADPDDATAVAPAAHALAYVVMDLDAGAAYIERALASNLNDATSWMISGWINVWLGRGDVAIEHVARAMRLSPRDPRSDTMRSITAHAHYFAGRYNEALSWASLALQERPNAHQALRIGAAAAAMAGYANGASTLRQKLMQADPRLRLSTLRDVLGPYRDPEHPARYVEGLRRAGLPE